MPNSLVQVLDRTIRVDYKIPSRPKVSDLCVDFLAKMLVADPAQRITIQGIYEHPWFKQGFPASVYYLRLPLPPAVRFQGAFGLHPLPKAVHG